MIKKPLFIGAIASIIAINSVFANTIVTSQTYVDNADALKQDKITAGTTGNVVLYNGTQNGQTQFSERAIYDGTNDYDETTDANKLITAGAVNTMAPELPTGTRGYAVLYDENGDIGDGMTILSDTANFLSGESPYDMGSDERALLTQNVLWYNTDESLNLSGSPSGHYNVYPTASGVKGFAQSKIPAGTLGSVVIYDGTQMVGGYPEAKFTERAITYSVTQDSGNLITSGGVYTAISAKQNKMTCTRWIDNAAHTDANCLLWSMAN